jgi:hypothetical protein
LVHFDDTSYFDDKFESITWHEFLWRDPSMNQTWTFELFVYLATALSALLLLPRCVNWRLRLVVGTIGMQALAQSLGELRLHHPFWQTRLGSVAGITEMFAGALALTAIYLLRRENKERKSTDARLRLSEAAEGIPARGQSLSDIGAGPRVASPVSRDSIIPDTAAGIVALDAAVSDSGSLVPQALAPNPDSEPSQKRRRTRRFPISLLAKIARLDGPKGVMEGEIGDISQGGARLRLPEFVPPGGLVKVEFRNRMFLGEVRSCEESQGCFIAGVQFEHMVDLTELSRILREIGIEAQGTGASVNPRRDLVNQNRSFAGKNSVINSSQ